MFGCNFKLEKCKTVLKLSEASIEYYWLTALDVHGQEFSNLVENPNYGDVKGTLCAAIDFLKHLHPKRRNCANETIDNIKTVPLLFELFLKLWNRFLQNCSTLKSCNFENLTLLNKHLSAVNCEIKKLSNTVVIVA